jgi:hypothetical protein
MATVHQRILEPCSPFCETPHYHTLIFSGDSRAVAVQKMLGYAVSMHPAAPTPVPHGAILEAMELNNYFSKFKVVARTTYAHNLGSVLGLLRTDSVDVPKVVQMYADILESSCTAHVNHHVFSTLFAYLHRGALQEEYTSEVRLIGGVVCKESFFPE